jgi:lipoic acid synthetase
MNDVAQPKRRLPPWLKVRFPGGQNYLRLRSLIEEQQLHTVCQEARCPNIGECWERGTATFMILGDTCTRACGFCAVTTGRPGAVDYGEPLRLARTVRTLGLKHAVITCVTRDDLPDGGAAIFASTTRAIRSFSPGTSVELLISDLMGNWDALATIMAAQPEVLNHNTETVPRLYRHVRPKARYERSLELLERAKALDPGSMTKSGLMAGLGESREELLAVFADLRARGVDILTVGQYLQPSRQHLPVARFYEPAEFEELKDAAYRLGFAYVEAGPLVRSSYHAESHVPGLRPRPHAPALDTLIPLEERGE